MSMTAAAGVAITAGAALGGYAYAIEPRRFMLRHVELRTRRPPPRPFRVLQISDSHFMGGQPWKERFFASLAAQEVDFVLLLGDLIETDSGTEPLLRCIRRLRPRYGTYAVLGAHDFLYPGLSAIARDVLAGGRHHTARNDGRRLIQGLWEAGVHLFRNDGFVLEPGPASPFPEPVWFCGLSDASLGWDNVPRALRGRPDGLYTLMLTHALHDFHDILEAEPDVCFGGHSHGGQVRLPFLGATVTRSSLPSKYARGWFRLHRTAFHINHGMGAGRWTHLRFNCRPEATVVDVA